MHVGMRWLSVSGLFRALLGQAKGKTMILNQLLYIITQSLFIALRLYTYTNHNLQSRICLKNSVFILTLRILKTAFAVSDLSALET